MGEVLKEYESTNGSSHDKLLTQSQTARSRSTEPSRKYPLVEESTLDETNYVSVEFCNRREGVEMQTLLNSSMLTLPPYQKRATQINGMSFGRWLKSSLGGFGMIVRILPICSGIQTWAH